MNAQTYQKFQAAHPDEFQRGREQLQAILARSATDVDFRQKLLADSRSAVAEFTGEAVPESWNVVFVENQANATIVLPDPVGQDSELSDTELETVAGGITFLAAVAVAAGVTLVGSVAAYLALDDYNDKLEAQNAAARQQCVAGS